MRAVSLRYEDPLDRVWTECAARLGWRVVRTPEVFASTDGRGTMTLAPDDALDADDCLAQIIFHEVCHWLVQGSASRTLPDWGLDNQTDVDSVREHACLRLQALLAGPHGLRAVLAPTTDYRAFYDALADDPLGTDESSRLARQAAGRAAGAPWDPHLQQALVATEQVVRATAAFADSATSLFSRLAPRMLLHRSGFPLAGTQACGTCAWRDARGFCLQSTVRVGAELPACERWEADALDCAPCGACCREGYDTVEIGARDPVRSKHPALVSSQNGRLGIARDGERCAALTGGRGEAPHRCGIYQDRPKPCRELTEGSANCLIARRRVGLSR